MNSEAAVQVDASPTTQSEQMKLPMEPRTTAQKRHMSFLHRYKFILQKNIPKKTLQSRDSFDTIVRPSSIPSLEVTPSPSHHD